MRHKNVVIVIVHFITIKRDNRKNKEWAMKNLSVYESNVIL